jgi:hypothetical protein
MVSLPEPLAPLNVDDSGLGERRFEIVVTVVRGDEGSSNFVEDNNDPLSLFEEPWDNTL